MPRYVIEMDEPRSCYTCACINAQLGQCQLTYKTVPKSMGIPEWCPLKPLEDSSLTKQADATLTSVQHFVNDSGPFPVEWDFETIRCHGCGETFVALVAGRNRFCPRCGARLNVTHASEVKQQSYMLVSVDGDRRAQELRELRKKLDL